MIRECRGIFRTWRTMNEADKGRKAKESSSFWCYEGKNEGSPQTKAEMHKRKV